MRTLGGLPAYSQFTVPKEINTAVFDISSWSQSLANASNLTIVELIDDSLVPISEFIEEDNLKEALYDYYENGLDSYFDPLIEPHIEVRPKTNENEEIQVAYLVSRYGDYLTLTEWNIYPHSADSDLKQLINYLHEVYPSLKVELYRYNTRDFINPGLMPYELCDFRPEDMKKFVDPKTGKTYLLRAITGQGKKFAFTLYDQNVINDYTFDNIIKQMPVATDETVETIRRDYQRLIAL